MNKKLMCPVDGSPASQKAALFALQLARLLDIPLSFVTVYHAHHRQPGAEILEVAATAADPALAAAAQAAAGGEGGDSCALSGSMATILLRRWSSLQKRTSTTTL